MLIPMLPCSYLILQTTPVRRERPVPFLRKTGRVQGSGGKAQAPQ